MIDKLAEYRASLDEFHTLLRALGGDDRIIAASEKVSAAGNALLDEMVDTIGRLDVALAELEVDDTPDSHDALAEKLNILADYVLSTFNGTTQASAVEQPTPVPAFVDQHGKAVKP